MMLAGVRVANSAIAELAWLVREAGADRLADRLERAVTDPVSVLALTIDDGRSSSTSSKTHRTGLPSCAPFS